MHTIKLYFKQLLCRHCFARDAWNPATKIVYYRCRKCGKSVRGQITK